MPSIRKVVCISYQTGKSAKRSSKEFPETKLLTVGSAFVDSETGTISGQFRAIPPQWDGKFLLFDPLPKRNGHERADDAPAE